jgi:hypothetical protein
MEVVRKDCSALNLNVILIKYLVREIIVFSLINTCDTSVLYTRTTTC